MDPLASRGAAGFAEHPVVEDEEREAEDGKGVLGSIKAVDSPVAAADQAR